MSSYFDNVSDRLTELRKIILELTAAGHFSQPQRVFLERYIFKEGCAIQASDVFETLTCLGYNVSDRISEFVQRNRRPIESGPKLLTPPASPPVVSSTALIIHPSSAQAGATAGLSVNSLQYEIMPYIEEKSIVKKLFTDSNNAVVSVDNPTTSLLEGKDVPNENSTTTPAALKAPAKEQLKSAPQVFRNSNLAPRNGNQSKQNIVTAPAYNRALRGALGGDLRSSRWNSFGDVVNVEKAEAGEHYARCKYNLENNISYVDEKPFNFNVKYIQTAVQDGCTVRTGVTSHTVSKVEDTPEVPTATTVPVEHSTVTKLPSTESVPATRVAAILKQEDNASASAVSQETVPSTASSGGLSQESGKTVVSKSTVFTIPDKFLTKRKPKAGIFAKLVKVGEPDQQFGFDTLARLGGRQATEDNDILVPIVLRNGTQIKALSTQKAFPPRGSNGVSTLAINYSDVLTILDTRYSHPDDVSHLATNKRTGERGIVRVRAVDMDQEVARNNVFIRGRSARKDARYGF